MVISKVEVTLIKLISAMGMIQGLAWTTLSFICIVMYNVSSNLDIDWTSYSSVLQGFFYYRFLKADDTVLLLGNSVIRPSDFTVFMWIYFLSSAIWTALSIDQYVAAHTDKRRLSTVLILWSVVAVFFSILDLILMSLMARDYENCSATKLDESVVDTSTLLCYIVNGIVMTLAARGFLLWVINIVCCVALMSIGIMIKKHAYAQKNMVIPRVKLGGDAGNNSWRNSKFAGESNSWRNPKPPTPENNGGDWRSPGGNFGEPQYLRENKRFA